MLENRHEIEPPGGDLDRAADAAATARPDHGALGDPHAVGCSRKPGAALDPAEGTDGGLREMHGAGEARALRIAVKSPSNRPLPPSAIFPGGSSCARSPAVPSIRAEKPSSGLQDPVPATASERVAPRKDVTETLPRSSDAAASKATSSPGQDAIVNLVARRPLPEASAPVPEPSQCRVPASPRTRAAIPPGAAGNRARSTARASASSR